MTDTGVVEAGGMTTMTRWLHQLQQYDLRMLLWFMQRRHRQLWVLTARASSRSGDGFLQVALPGLLWLLDPGQGKRLFLLAIPAFAIERSIYWCLKNSCQRRRPPEAIPSFRSVITAADRFSFPSGHTSGAFTLATLVALHYSALAGALYLWAFTVGLSRVVLGVHFPSDILAGALLGTGIAWLTSEWLLQGSQVDQLLLAIAS